MFSVVKMMKEQGNQFDWSQIAIDIPSLPCFKPEAEWPALGDEDVPIADVLAEGYQVIRSLIVKVTGENPSVTAGINPTFTDCEPVLVGVDGISALSPVRFMTGTSEAVADIFEGSFSPTMSHVWGPVALKVDANNFVVAVGYKSGSPLG